MRQKYEALRKEVLKNCCLSEDTLVNFPEDRSILLPAASWAKIVLCALDADPANDGPEVSAINFFNRFPEGI